MTKTSPNTQVALSPDVIARLQRVNEMLGGMSIPLGQSEPPENLIPDNAIPKIEVAATGSGEKRPVLDAATFEVLTKVILKQTQTLREELGRRIELLGVTAEAVPTPSGRWYFRIEDSKGQRLDVVFGSGLFCGARIYFHEHMGRAAVDGDISPEAARELASVLAGANLTPTRLDVPDDDEDVDEDDEEEPQEETDEEKQYKIAQEQLRRSFFASAKGFLDSMVKRAPVKRGPLEREIKRKKAEEYSVADLDRILSTLTNQTVMLEAFTLESYDGSTIRLSRTGDDGEESYIEMYRYQDDDEAQVWLRAYTAPEEDSEREVKVPLEQGMIIEDSVEDDVVTIDFEVTGTGFGLALLRFGAKTTEPPAQLDHDDELVELLQPKATPEPETPEIKPADDEQQSGNEPTNGSDPARVGKRPRKAQPKKGVAKKKAVKKKAVKKKAVKKPALKKRPKKRPAKKPAAKKAAAKKAWTKKKAVKKAARRPGGFGAVGQP